MAVEKQEEAEGSTLEQVIDQRTRTTLLDVRWLLGLVVGGLVTVFGGGWYAFGQVRIEATSAAKDVVITELTKNAGVLIRVDALEQRASADASAVNHRLDRVEQIQLEQGGELRGVREDLRIVFPRQLPKLVDAGQ